MKIIRGRGVSRGVAQGPVHFFLRTGTAVERRQGCDPQGEQARLKAARLEAARNLQSMARRAREQGGDEAAALFEAHCVLLKDQDFAGTMDLLAARGFNAEYAVAQAEEQCAAMLAAMDDPYIQARAADVHDVAGQLLNLLTGAAGPDLDLQTPVILCADDLSPSETIRLDRSKLLAIATREGSDSSHTAILARTLGIPAVCGLGDSLSEALEGRQAFLVGDTGELIFDPDRETLASLRARQDQQARRCSRLAHMADQEDITRDGRRLQVCCNIASPEDVQAVLANGGRGVGLFRTEFLYLAARDCPDEQTQFAAYKQVLQAMGERRVVIRTLDIGADKQASCLPLPREENPALGMRAIRLCLTRPQLFRTQLRAIYRASAYGRAAIMFPMITSPWEVAECRRICGEVMAELTAEGIPFCRETEVGIMVETPAAVLMAPELAKLADFFSVGTNDLTQYTLACDRQNSGLGPFFDPCHPAVLRAVKLAADAAHQAGIWIGVCGELAADPALVPTFLALGIDELSVAPGAVLPLRAAIRESTAGDCTLERLAL